MNEEDKMNEAVTAKPVMKRNWVYINYTNHRGLFKANRVIEPKALWWGCTKWHTKNQWMLDAYDHDKSELRSFAIADISYWSTNPYLDLIGDKTVVEWKKFARQDDCLDKMVPSDLRQIMACFKSEPV